MWIVTNTYVIDTPTNCFNTFSVIDITYCMNIIMMMKYLTFATCLFLKYVCYSKTKWFIAFVLMHALPLSRTSDGGAAGQDRKSRPELTSGRDGRY
jgi:hypothetical protein